jgi:hypothetical protein
MDPQLNLWPVQQSGHLVSARLVTYLPPFSPNPQSTIIKVGNGYLKVQANDQSLNYESVGTSTGNNR